MYPSLSHPTINDIHKTKQTLHYLSFPCRSDFSGRPDYTILYSSSLVQFSTVLESEVKWGLPNLVCLLYPEPYTPQVVVTVGVVVRWEKLRVCP